MSQEKTMTFHFADGRPPRDVRFSLEAGDVRMLSQFLDEARGLQAHMLAVGGIPVRFSIQGHEGGKFSISSTEPNKTIQAATLHILRPFLLEEEPFSFKRVRGIVNRSTRDDFLLDRLKQIKQLYTGARLRSLLKVQVGEIEITSESAFQKWLYGLEYHRDADKADALEHAHGVIPLSASRPLFLAQLGHKSNAVLHLGHIVAKMLESPPVLPGPTDLDVQD